jgi:hypothetical protein
VPEELKAEIEAGVRKRNRKKPNYQGRTAEESAYAIMNAMGAMHGSKTTAKGRRMEKKVKDEDPILDR